ncbi:MAG: rod-binding protein [Pseudomonadota bacterium]
MNPISALSATTKPTDSDMIAIKDTRAANPLRMKGATKASADKIDQTASEFESQFISQMVGTMFSTVDAHDALGGSDAEEVYNSMLTNEYGKIIARTGGIGVADQVKKIMLKQQEVE